MYYETCKVCNKQFEASSNTKYCSMACYNKAERERRSRGHTKLAWLKIRFEVLERDNFRCQYCGTGVKDGIQLHVDHIVPVCEGGTDDMSNLVTACIDCNRGKGGDELLTPPLLKPSQEA